MAQEIRLFQEQILESPAAYFRMAVLICVGILVGWSGQSIDAGFFFTLFAVLASVAKDKAWNGVSTNSGRRAWWLLASILAALVAVAIGAPALFRAQH